MNSAQVKELLLQTLESESGGVEVFTTARRCALDPELEELWECHLAQTRAHVSAVRGLLDTFGIDADELSSGRVEVREMCGSIVRVIENASDSGSPEAAQIVAAECVVLAATKSHHFWGLIGEVSKKIGEGPEAEAMRAVHARIEPEADEHLRSSQAWSRQLWIAALGMSAGATSSPAPEPL